ETTEGCVGDGVGVERRGDRPDRRIEIGVVAMEQRTIRYGSGKIGGKPATRRVTEVYPQYVAVVVVARFVVDQEVVALAGRRHVVVAVGPDLHRLAGALGGDGGKSS